MNELDECMEGIENITPEQYVGVILTQIAGDFEDYYYNCAETEDEQKKYKKLSKKARELATKIGGKPVKWLENEGFIALPDELQEDFAHLHPTTLLDEAVEILKLLNSPFVDEVDKL